MAFENADLYGIQVFGIQMVTVNIIWFSIKQSSFLRTLNLSAVKIHPPT